MTHQPVTVFISYSHADEGFRQQLEEHLSALRRQQVIASWHDRKLVAGAELDDSITRAAKKSTLFLMLVSPSFIASDYCYEREMQLALHRHKERTARVVPIIVRAVDWEGLPFSHLLALPTDGKPIASWMHRDEAWLDVVRGLKAALKEIVPQPAVSATAAARRSADPGKDLVAMREIYDWLFSSEGPDFTTKSALEWAEILNDADLTREQFDVMKLAYPWLFSSEGPDLTSTSAFDTTLAYKNRFRMTQIHTLISLYDWLYSEAGPDFTSESALECAEELVASGYDPDRFERLRAAFEWLYSEDGPDIKSTEAAFNKALSLVEKGFKVH